MEYDLEKILDKWDTVKIKYDRDHIRGWLFEYGCQMVEYLNIKPTTAPKFVMSFARQKAKEVLSLGESYYKNHTGIVNATNAFKYDIIPKIVKSEYGRLKE